MNHDGVDIDAVHRKTFPACQGPCNQGRNLCPCPAACQVPDGGMNCAAGIVLGLVAALAIWAAAVVMVMAF